MSSKSKGKRKHSDAGTRPPHSESMTPEGVHTREHEDLEDIARGSVSQWENCIANDHARIHNGHVHIQNQYYGHNGGSSQPAQAATGRVDFMKALEFDHMDSRYESIDPAHLNTCRWLFEGPEYTQWRDNSRLGMHHGFLWIKGKAGSGKSTLMKCALEHAQATLRNDKIISFFFNNRGRDLERSVEGMYRSLLSQMIRHFPDLRATYPSYCPESVQQHGWVVASLRNHFGQSLLILNQEQAVTIYVDALDECDEDEVRAAIDHFEELSSLSVSRNVPIHICFASRHYPRITTHWCVELILDDQDGHHQDIKTYIDHKLPIRDAGLKSRLATQIRIRSCGVFFWVVLVVRMIRKQFDSGAPYQQLLRTLQEVPAELQALIGAIVQLPDDALLWAMRWMLFARERVTVQQLYSAIQTGIGLIDSACHEPSTSMEAFILASSRGLIEITFHHYVQLVHESVKEYLLAGGLTALGTCSEPIVEASIHADLFKCCHTYLRLTSGGILASPDQCPERLWTDPLLHYAASNVLQHLQVAVSMRATCLCGLHGLPLEPLLYILPWYYCKNEKVFGVRPCLPKVHSRYSALLFLASLLPDGKLLKAMLAPSEMDPGTYEDQGLPTALSHSCDFSPGEEDINVFIKGEQSSLLAIALARSLDVTELLVDRGADINADGGAPLSIAIERCDLKAVKYLLSRGARTEVTIQGCERNLLTRIIERCSLEIMTLLLEHGADPNGCHDASVISPLLAALKLPLFNTGRKIEPKDWVAHGALGVDDAKTIFRSLNEDDESTYREKCETIICTLLDHGADINLEAGPCSISPLRYSVEHHSKSVVHLLLIRGRSSNHSSSNLLVWAATKLNVEVVEHFLQTSLRVESKQQALEAALLADDQEISRWTSEYQGIHAGKALLRITQLLRGAGLGMDEGSAKFRAQIVDVFLRLKDWSIRYQDDETMSLGAARLLFFDTVMSSGASLPLTRSRVFGSGDTVAFGQFEGDYETALITASATGRLDLVRLLLENGADPNFKSSRFGRALDVALLRGHTKIAKVLDAASSNPSTNHGAKPRTSNPSLRSTTKPWLL